MENEEKTPAPQTEIQEAAAETPKKRCASPDARTFLIAFLTSLIVVLAYHGIITAFECWGNRCQVKAKFCVKQCGMRPEGRKFHKRMNFEKRRPRRPRCKDENCQKPHHRHHFKDKADKAQNPPTAAAEQQ